MKLAGADLRITNVAGTAVGYVIDETQQNPVVHTKTAPNVPLQTGGVSSATQAGSAYDVRDTEGDKAIASLDWTGGAGQESFDYDGASSSKFFSSKNFDISKRGRLTLLRAIGNWLFRRTWLLTLTKALKRSPP